MQEAVLYTGTFDPYHLGHLKQLEFTYAAHPFQKAVIAVIRRNQKSPTPHHGKNVLIWRDWRLIVSSYRLSLKCTL